MLQSVFCALVTTGKRSADELFMHYFHNLSSASWLAHGPRPPPELQSLTPLGNFRPHIPNLPSPGRNPSGAHGQEEPTSKEMGGQEVGGEGNHLVSAVKIY